MHRSGGRGGRVAEPETLVGSGYVDRERMPVRLKRRRRKVRVDKPPVRGALDLGVGGKLEPRHLRRVGADVAARVAQRALSVRPRARDPVEHDVVAISRHVERAAVFYVNDRTLREDALTSEFRNAALDGYASHGRQVADEHERSLAVLDNLCGSRETCVTDRLHTVRLARRNGEAERTRAIDERHGLRGKRRIGGKVQFVSVQVDGDAVRNQSHRRGPVRVLGQPHKHRKSRCGSAGGRADQCGGIGNGPSLPRHGRALGEVGRSGVAAGVQEHLAACAVEERALSAERLDRHKVAHHEPAVIDDHRVKSERTRIDADIASEEREVARRGGRMRHRVAVGDVRMADLDGRLHEFPESVVRHG